MIDERKTRKLKIIIISIILLLIGGIIWGTFTFRPKPVVFPKQIKQAQKVKNKRAVLSHSSSKESNSQQSFLETFLKQYWTQDLDEEKINARASVLKNMMSDESYQRNYIQSESSALVGLLKKYQATKQIDTSNSTLLNSREYLKSNIYTQQNSTDHYYVELYYKEAPVYQSEGYVMEAKVNYVMSGSKISDFQIIEQKMIPGGKTNG